MRLQKYMAECGVASRRKCEEYIAQGRVTVNGERVTHMGAQVEQGDQVTFDGEPIQLEKRRQYIMLNKPRGVVTTLSDPQGRKTVRDLIEGIPERIYPVGRLDWDTCGLLIMTNDGELMQTVTHPSHQVEKVYLARVRGELSEQELGRLECGLTLDDGHRTAPARVTLLPDDPALMGQKSLYIAVHEGHNRLVRRMFEAVGAQVMYLRRERVGKLSLGHLKEGAWRHLSEKEVEYLRSLAKEDGDEA